MIAKGHKQPGAKLAGALEKATDGAVTRYDLRPDVFGNPPTPHTGEAA
jgi:DNA-binding transcriptional regulator YdaS (Cro superfamily)